ncbi:MAG: FlgD immunoglobulin-like domain containing protein, partial [Gaiellaceae bacterium]
MRGLVVTVLVLGLLGASVAAFATTEALKLEKSPVGASRFDRQFSPTCGCPRQTARLAVGIRKSDSVDATIVDAAGEEVRTLAEDLEHERGFLRLEWDGRNDAGRIVPDGRYRVRVHLDGDRRTIVIPKTIRVDTAPPRVELVRAVLDVVSPDGDGRRDRTRLVYRASEAGAARLLVDGEVARETVVRYRRQATVAWNGMIAGEPARAAVYGLAVQVRDLAGNVSEPTEAILVAVRYVVLDAARYRVRAGRRLRFRVGTDAERFSWTLRRSGTRRIVLSGFASGPVVSVRVPKRLGGKRYVLRVVALGHAARASLIV